MSAEPRRRSENQGCPDRQLEDQDEEPAERRGRDRPPFGGDLTVESRYAGTRQITAAAARNRPVRQSSRPTAAGTPRNRSAQPSRRVSQARTPGTKTPRARPWSTVEARIPRFRGHGPSRAACATQHEIAGPDRRPGQPQQQGSKGSSHVSCPRIWYQIAQPRSSSPDDRSGTPSSRIDAQLCLMRVRHVDPDGPDLIAVKMAGGQCPSDPPPQQAAKSEQAQGQDRPRPPPRSGTRSRAVPRTSGRLASSASLSSPLTSRFSSRPTCGTVASAERLLIADPEDVGPDEAVLLLEHAQPPRHLFQRLRARATSLVRAILLPLQQRPGACAPARRNGSAPGRAAAAPAAPARASCSTWSASESSISSSSTLVSVFS